MVVEERRDGEGAKTERLPMAQEPAWAESSKHGREIGSSQKHRSSFLAYVHRDVDLELRRESVVVEMWMGDHEREQRRVGLSKARHRRKVDRLSPLSPQWAT